MNPIKQSEAFKDLREHRKQSFECLNGKKDVVFNTETIREKARVNPEYKRDLLFCVMLEKESQYGYNRAEVMKSANFWCEISKEDADAYYEEFKRTCNKYNLY